MKKDGCFCELLESRVGGKLVKMLLVYFVSFNFKIMYDGGYMRYWVI